ncbi:MAG: hypothetical protein WD059_13645 [Balneolaceae bacterium]
MAKKVIHTARIILGAIFLIFGLNGFYVFIPVPEFHPFMEILVSSGYIYFIKTAEVVGGILLLTNRLVPLALIILAADIINITIYHVLLDPRNWIIVPILWVLLFVVLYGYRNYFKSLLTLKPKINI